MLYTLHFDGSCYPNPGGPAGSGYLLQTGKDVISWEATDLGTNAYNTNNMAEYDGLHRGLTAVLKDVPSGSTVNVYGDSQLVIFQMNKKWRINGIGKAYYDLAKKCEKLNTEIRKKRITLNFDWLPREQNQECDDLSKWYTGE